MHMCIILCVFMCTGSAFLSGISLITQFLQPRASSAIVRAYAVNSFALVYALVYAHVYLPVHYEEYYSKRIRQTDHSRACRTQGASR